MKARGIDGGGTDKGKWGMYDAPLLPHRSRVLARYCEPGNYPNVVTPRSIEAAVRSRVAGGMDFFDAQRQILEGVARWAEAEC